MRSERKPYLLRLDPRLFDALQRWARDDLRSLNAQIDWLLRQALAKAGRAQLDLERDGERDDALLDSPADPDAPREPPSS
ncbi:MAG: hypothetical protein JNL90_03585 [Planctomycetes bacterium]|nr:hypothetical protein [Planctomycetota bacterium]